MLPGLCKLNTMMGMPLSMHSVVAVESMTCSSREHLHVGNLVEFGRVGIGVRVAIVDAIDLRRLENGLGVNLAGTERGRGVGCEVRVTRAAREYDDAPFSRWRMALRRM